MNIQLPDISCTGCGACSEVCAKKAITMRLREDGFVYPVVDANKCVSCGLCMKSCHAAVETTLNRSFACYAAQIKRSDVLAASTSGGIFFALANEVLKNGGIVYGCIFDEQYNAYIARAESTDQLKPMHGSKYVWSDSSRSYPEVKQDIASGHQVLYTCLPCQAAGLRKYLGKPNDNLYIVDVLCGGSPSPFAFQKYLATITDEIGKKDLHFQFRDKEKYGSGVDCTYITQTSHTQNSLKAPKIRQKQNKK